MDDRFHEEEHGLKRSDRGWVILEGTEIQDAPEGWVEHHILPLGDSGRHWLQVGCPCKPEIQMMQAEEILYTHRAYDGREDGPDPLKSLLRDLLDC